MLRPVSLAAVCRHLAPATPDIDVCSLLALWVVADPSQLLAQTLVLWIVLHRVRLAAVDRHSAPGTLSESAPDLQIGGTRLACCQLASPRVLLLFLCFVFSCGDVFLSACVDE
jgi:hypothetical protein